MSNVNPHYNYDFKEDIRYQVDNLHTLKKLRVTINGIVS